MAFGDEEIGYRTSGVAWKPPAPTVTQDEEDVSTLRVVRANLAESIEGLYKDFNAFELLKGATTARKKEELLYQIAIKQGVYEILAPLFDQVDSSIKSTTAKYKQKQG